MSVVAWFAVSAAIALFGLVYLFFHARTVWRKARLLLAEVATAVQRAEEASRPGQQSGAPEAT